MNHLSFSGLEMTKHTILSYRGSETTEKSCSQTVFKISYLPKKERFEIVNYFNELSL